MWLLLSIDDTTIFFSLLKARWLFPSPHSLSSAILLIRRARGWCYEMRVMSCAQSLGGRGEGRSTKRGGGELAPPRARALLFPRFLHLSSFRYECVTNFIGSIYKLSRHFFVFERTNVPRLMMVSVVVVIFARKRRK